MLKTKLFKTAVITAALVILCAMSGWAEGLSLSLPDLDWALKINSPGFNIDSGGMRPDGLATQAMATNKSTGLVMSVFIEPAVMEGDSRAVRDYQFKGLKESPFMDDDVVFTEDGDVALLEYFISEYQGVELNQRHVNAYYVKDGFWIDIHLSKVKYTDADKKLFDDVLASVEFVDGYVQTEFDNFIYASSFYMENNYEKAAIYYEKAAAKGRAETTLPEDLWRVAVDNLGMSYGISGDLQNSERVYLAGIEQDPDYPMFYYNIACTYAEMNDKDNALSNLRKAYEKKPNMIEGEQFPDPRTDSSFQRYLADPDFVALLDEYENK